MHTSRKLSSYMVSSKVRVWSTRNNYPWQPLICYHVCGIYINVFGFLTSRKKQTNKNRNINKIKMTTWTNKQITLFMAKGMGGLGCINIGVQSSSSKCRLYFCALAYNLTHRKILKEQVNLSSLFNVQLFANNNKGNSSNQRLRNYWEAKTLMS